jgi:hypothetical protein
VLNDSVLVYVQLQQLELRLVLFGVNRLQPHKYADLVDNRRLAKLHQPIHGRPNSCFYQLSLLVLPRVSVTNRLLHARQQIRPLYAYQIQQLLRPLQPQVHLVSLAVLDSVLSPSLNALLCPSYLLTYPRLCSLAVT